MKHGKLWTIAYAVVLTAFTAYTASDTFLIPRVYQVVDTASNASTSGNDSESTDTSSGTDTVIAAETDSETDTEAAASDSSADTSSSAESESQLESGQGFVITSKSSTSAEDTADSSSTAAADSSTTSADDSADSSDNSSADSSTASADDSTDGSSDASQVSSDSAVSSSLTDAEVISTDTYSDDNAAITVTTYYWNSTKIYVADVTVSSSDYLSTAFAQNSYGRNVTDETSDIAQSVNAVLAINGDYYGSQESGYVIRNGVLYRDTAARDQEDLVIYSDGTFSIINESEVTAEELMEDGAQQVLSFGPALVEDGQISVTQGEEVGKAMASNPRTAIGIVSSLHYVMVVADGRTSESAGLSLYELAEFMQSLGVETAYNLDGGGSSTMYFNGEVINNPTTNGNSIKERKVSDIIYVV